MATSGVYEDKTRQKRAAKATDLTPYVQTVWGTKGLEQKRTVALEVAEHMTAGKREQYRTSVRSAMTEAAIDRLATNTMLSGEGAGVLK